MCNEAPGFRSGPNETERAREGRFRVYKEDPGFARGPVGTWIRQYVLSLISWPHLERDEGVGDGVERSQVVAAQVGIESKV